VTLTRPTALRIAAVLAVAVSLFAIITYDIPTLVQGAAQTDGPYWLVLGSFATDVLALVGAYGAWRGQKWGAVLLIAVQAFWIVQAISGLLFEGGVGVVIFSSVMLVHHITVIILCLWREPAIVPA